jgi:hypothetical protein
MWQPVHYKHKNWLTAQTFPALPSQISIFLKWWNYVFCFGLVAVGNRSLDWCFLLPQLIPYACPFAARYAKLCYCSSLRLRIIWTSESRKSLPYPCTILCLVSGTPSVRFSAQKPIWPSKFPYRPSGKWWNSTCNNLYRPPSMPLSVKHTQ